MSGIMWCRLFCGVSACLVLPACGDGGSPTGPEPPEELVFEFTFQNSNEGFSIGFVDYPEGREVDFQLSGGWAALPQHDSLDAGDKGIMLHGSNRSEDLFIFVKRMLDTDDGVEAGVVYKLEMTIKLASNTGSGCYGIGGAPGKSVFLKAGAVPVEP
ncbi:MAG: hypothetical protein FVQ81_09200 [Candidatus Glassbacteria bacterium]|nr:hypothetical protein [Candidatus Glassbacteria bacterium]